MAIFRPKPWIDPFEKMSIFRGFCTSFFYSLERRFFVLDYPMLYCLKRKGGKMIIFGPKAWANLFRKMSIFRHFEPLFFIA